PPDSSPFHLFSHGRRPPPFLSPEASLPDASANDAARVLLCPPASLSSSTASPPRAPQPPPLVAGSSGSDGGRMRRRAVRLLRRGVARLLLPRPKGYLPLGSGGAGRRSGLRRRPDLALWRRGADPWQRKGRPRRQRSSGLRLRRSGGVLARDRSPVLLALPRLLHQADMMASSSPSGRASPHAPPSIHFSAVGAVGAVGPIFSGRRRKSGPDPDRRWARREASRGLAAGGRGRASNRAAAEGQGAGCRPSLLRWPRPPLLLWRARGGFEQAAVTRIRPLVTRHDLL
ncbi:unnamed protein product, partial [Urochloa humidicola]